MSGLGMTQRGARALCLALSGIEPCNLCKGHGWCDPAVFDAFADSSVLRKSAKDVFAEVDQDKNGSVDFDELRSIVQRLGFSISKDDMLTVWRCAPLTRSALLCLNIPLQNGLDASSPLVLDSFSTPQVCDDCALGLAH
jgi:hypothetical protein